MTAFEKLVVYFEKFPGVGVRQAKRFAFHVLTLRSEQVDEFSHLITSLSHSVSECVDCHRFFSPNNSKTTVITCSLCSDVNRDSSKLLIVASDNDIQAIERSNVYDGLYFVLGGTVPLLYSKNEDDKKLRGGALKALVARRSEKEVLEIILGFAINPDGENTARYVETLLRDFETVGKVKISHLGRGLSTGSELEYADTETIRSALRNRM